MLLAGQSNMSGRGTASNPDDESCPGVWQFGNSGAAAGRVVPAVSPLAMHDVPSGIGPGIGFARRYRQWLQGGPVLLVPVAHGGTGLVARPGDTLSWDVGFEPASGSLAANAVRQLRAARAAAGPRSRWVATLWVQGETDGDRGIPGPVYAEHLRTLVRHLRTAAGPTDPDPVPFVVGGMVPDFLSGGTRRAIDDAQRNLAATLPATTFADGPPGAHAHDGNHYDATGQHRLAAALFAAYADLVTAASPAPGARPAAP